VNRGANFSHTPAKLTRGGLRIPFPSAPISPLFHAGLVAFPVYFLSIQPAYFAILLTLLASILAAIHAGSVAIRVYAWVRGNPTNAKTHTTRGTPDRTPGRSRHDPAQSQGVPKEWAAGRTPASVGNTLDWPLTTKVRL
jgi:hypothetical protein